ncbi:hypothetical protein FKM82_018044 [Ascaphus truei]
MVKCTIIHILIIVILPITVMYVLGGRAKGGGCIYFKVLGKKNLGTGLVLQASRDPRTPAWTTRGPPDIHGDHLEAPGHPRGPPEGSHRPLVSFLCIKLKNALMCDMGV